MHNISPKTAADTPVFPVAFYSAFACAPKMGGKGGLPMPVGAISFFMNLSSSCPTANPATSALFLLVRGEFAGRQYRFARGGLADGIYFYKVEMEGVGAYGGKVVLK